MNLKNTVENVLLHPYCKEAVNRYKEGEPNDLKFLLIDLVTHVYQQTSHHCALKFRRVKQYPNCEIYYEIKDIEPPENLNFWLKKPTDAELAPLKECKVIEFTEAVKKVKRDKMVIIANQLRLFNDHKELAEA